MSVPSDFARMVPGFDFLQGVMKTAAGGGMPGMNQWIAPTLDPDELAKRIDQLRTVQFWLEQNARMLGATVQALEVQRMTLTTLKTMNLPLADLQKSMSIGGTAAGAAAGSAAGAATAAPTAGAVDPMQWWSALTQQFTELAAGAMKDAGAATQPQPSAEPTPAADATTSAAAGPAKRGNGR